MRILLSYESMKIAISIPDDLAIWVKKESKKRVKSRSSIVTAALTEYIHRLANHTLLKEINLALDEIETEKSDLDLYKKKHRKLIGNADRYF